MLTLGDEVQRRAQKSAVDRAKKGQLDPQMGLERWDRPRRSPSISSSGTSW
ncbi:MAG: hypothetical protein R3F65_29800 [bacterium]